jgi:hypothetical protein
VVRPKVNVRRLIALMILVGAVLGLALGLVGRVLVIGAYFRGGIVGGGLAAVAFIANQRVQSGRCVWLTTGKTQS